MFFLLQYCARWGKFCRRRRQPKKARTVRPLLECLEDRFVPSTYVVNNTHNSGTGSLNWAITSANGNTSQTNTIAFDLGLNNIILLSSALPAITNPVVIDGTTNPMSAHVVLDGANVAGNANGLTLGYGGSTVRGLDIISWPGDGIYIDSPDNIIEDDAVGVFGGIFADGNGNGIAIEGPDGGNNLIGGFLPADANTISDNHGDGVIIDGNTDNTVVGNFIGTNDGGTVRMGNGNDGIHILGGAGLNFIGEEDSVPDAPPAVGNVISGNGKNGVEISGAGTESNLVFDNHIGTNSTGTAALGNGANGVLIDQGASDNIIGAGDPAYGNTISGNGTGVSIIGSGTDTNLVLGNKIGTSGDGTGELPNVADGVDIESGASDNGIDDNVISANKGNGIGILDNGTTGNQITGNMIGTTLDGSVALPNGEDGVFISTGASGNTIGGTATGDGNVISGNAENGIGISFSADSNTVEGNLIGVNKADTKALGNQQDGIVIFQDAEGNFIGGAHPEADVGNVISGNGLNGVVISFGAQGNFLLANHIGTDQTGTLKLPNQKNGVYIDAGAIDNDVGSGTGFGANLIVYNDVNGVFISSQGTTGNVVAGNKIGTNSQGTAAMPNEANGVEISNDATGNTIGGTTAGDRNLISGNGNDGVLIYGQGASHNKVEGNLIGTNGGDTGPLANLVGVEIAAGATNNTIGGTASGDTNVISGNKEEGVIITGAGTTGNVVAGNDIGTDLAGTTAIPNGDSGVAIENGASGNTIGNPSQTSPNIISGNKGDGIHITGAGTDNNVVEENFIGTDSSGTVALGNAYFGVYISDGASDNTVGDGNIISGNTFDGVRIEDAGTTGNSVQNNLIGLNIYGTGAIPNKEDGVHIDDGASGNSVNLNVISGNTYNGIYLYGTTTEDNGIHGNYIGTEVDGTTPLPNSYGVFIADGSNNNVIGGPNFGNTIADNTHAGIAITGNGSISNTISQNSIYGNGTIGIDLGNTGVTSTNSPGGPHTGPNHLQNYPVLTSSTTPNSVTVTLTAPKNASYTIEFFASATATPGQGQIYLGSMMVHVGASGTATFTYTFSSLPSTTYVTATATDANGDTSEFSAPLQVVAAYPT